MMLRLWYKVEFEELYFEAETIQASVKTTQKPLSVAEISTKFKECMAKGNISSTVYLFINNMEKGVLPLNKDTHSKLQKHSNSRTASTRCLIKWSFTNYSSCQVQTNRQRNDKKGRN